MTDLAPTPERWHRLLVEHQEQKARRLDREVSAPRSRWLGWLVLGTMVAVAVVLIGAHSVYLAAAKDPSRCTLPDRAVRAEVSVMGWGSADECTFYDAEGQPVFTDGRFAGPVTRSASDVLGDNAWSLLGGAAVLAGAGLVARSRFRSAF